MARVTGHGRFCVVMTIGYLHRDHPVGTGGVTVSKVTDRDLMTNGPGANPGEQKDWTIRR